MFPAHPVVFDFITISTLTLVLIALMKAHHRNTGSLLGSISQTVAYSKKSSTIFSITMTVCFPLYYAFVWFWVLPLIQAPHWIYCILLFSALCEMVFVWVPATVGKSKRIHEIATSIVVVAMFLLALVILFTGINLSIAARTSLIIFLASPFVIGILMVIKRDFVNILSCTKLYAAYCFYLAFHWLGTVSNFS
jgi:hypothetical protein